MLEVTISLFDLCFEIRQFLTLVLATVKRRTVHLRSEHIIVQFIFEMKQLLTLVLATGNCRTVHLRSEHIIVILIVFKLGNC